MQTYWKSKITKIITKVEIIQINNKKITTYGWVRILRSAQRFPNPIYKVFPCYRELMIINRDSALLSKKIHLRCINSTRLDTALLVTVRFF